MRPLDECIHGASQDGVFKYPACKCINMLREMIEEGYFVGSFILYKVVDGIP